MVAVETGFIDTFDSTVLYVPSIRLIVGGDVVYNGIHLYLGEITAKTRLEWKKALDNLVKLQPKWLVVDHKQPSFADEPVILMETKRYLEDFERLNAETSTTIELHNAMIALYPEHANPGSLWGGALAAKSTIM